MPGQHTGASPLCSPGLEEHMPQMQGGLESGQADGHCGELGNKRLGRVGVQELLVVGCIWLLGGGVSAEPRLSQMGGHSYSHTGLTWPWLGT